MLIFNVNLLKRKKKPVVVSEITNNHEIYFCYKTKGKLVYENLSVPEFDSTREIELELIEKHIKAVLDNFNKTLRPDESKRIYHSFYIQKTFVTLERVILNHE